MSHHFFLSYARAITTDRDLLEKFVSDLVDEIRGRLRGVPSDKICFRDQRSIGVGEDWPAELDNAVRSCKAFVPLYSGPYFDSEYCGKEWQVFRSRLEAVADGKSNPPLILPIIWQPARSLPDVAERLQYSHEDFGDEYAKRGLKRLMLRSLKDEYHEFVDLFAERLIQVVEDHALPEAPVSIPALEEAPNVFATRHQSTKGPFGDPRGCNSVQFVLVAGTRQEIEKICEDEHRQCYGDCCTAWRPFFPECGRSVGPLVQEIACQEDLTSASVCAVGDSTGMLVAPGAEAPNLLQSLKRWRDGNVLVLIVVDPWTIQRPDYRQLMREIDDCNLINCDLIVAWNDKHARASGCSEELKQALDFTFQNRAVSFGEGARWEELKSVDHFQEDLRRRLMHLRGNVIKLQDVKRRARGDGVIRKPTISGTGQDD